MAVPASAPTTGVGGFTSNTVPTIFVAFIIFTMLAIIFGVGLSPIKIVILGAVAIMMGMAFTAGIQDLINAMFGS